MGKLEEHVRNLLTPLDRQGLDDVADDIAELESKLHTSEVQLKFANARAAEAESRLDTAQSDLAESEGHCKALFENLQQATTKLEKVMATPNVSLSTYEAVEAERNSAVLRLGHFQRALEGIRHMGSDNYGLLTEAAKAADFALNATEADFVVETHGRKDG